MKRNIVSILVLFIMALFLSACVITPPSPTEKAQYIATARATLDSAGMGIEIASIVFFGLCDTGDLPITTCTTGKTSIKRWDSLYTSTQDTIMQYELGKITEREVVVKAVAEVVALFILVRHDLRVAK